MLYYAAKAAIVPHVVLAMANIISPTSFAPYRRVNAILAATGPMTHSTNAEKDPTKAIIELNSGMKMDTATARHAKTVRSTKMRKGLKIRSFFVPTFETSSPAPVGLSCEG